MEGESATTISNTEASASRERLMAQNNGFAGVHVMWVVVQSIPGVWIRWLHGEVLVMKVSSIGCCYFSLTSIMACYTLHAPDSVTVVQWLPISHLSDTGLKPEIVKSAGRVWCTDLIQPRCFAGCTKSLIRRQWKKMACGSPWSMSSTRFCRPPRRGTRQMSRTRLAGRSTCATSAFQDLVVGTTCSRAECCN
jgi:hypothetical protein